MHSKLITLSVIVLQPVAQTIATLAQKKVPSFKRTYKSKHTMTEENIVQENLQLETISPNNLKDRLETLVEEINKKDGEHVIVLVHPKLPNICLQISTKRKRPKKVAVTPHQKKTFCSPRLGRCPHCRKRTDVSKITEKQNRFKCKHKKCGKATAMKKWLCVKCSRTRKLISKSIVVIAMRRHS